MLLTSLKNMFGGIDVSSESLVEDPKLQFQGVLLGVSVKLGEVRILCCGFQEHTIV